MKTNWKKFSVLFIAALLSVSCGKDNKATGEAVAPVVNNTPIDSVVSGTSAGAKDFASFINEVEAGRFNGESNLSRVYTYGKSTQSTNVPEVHTDFWDAFKAQFQFNFYVCPGSNCPTNSGSSFPMRIVSANGDIARRNFSIDGNFGTTLVSLKANLVSLMRNAEVSRKCMNLPGLNTSGCLSVNELQDLYYGMITPYNQQIVIQYLQQAMDSNSKMFTFNYNDYSFIVDLNYPLAANPVGLMDLETGETYILIQ